LHRPFPLVRPIGIPICSLRFLRFAGSLSIPQRLGQRLRIMKFLSEISLGSNWQEKLTIVAEIDLFCLKGLPQHG